MSTILGIPIVECYKRTRRLVLLNPLERFRPTMSSIPGLRSKTLYYVNAGRVKVIATKESQRSYLLEGTGDSKKERHIEDAPSLHAIGREIAQLGLDKNWQG